MVMLMYMAAMSGTSEQIADLVRGKVGDNLHAFLEPVADAGYVVRIQDSEHDLAVNCQGNVHLGTLDHRRPVLIADRMAQFNAGADNCILVGILNSGEINYEDWIQL